MGLNQITTAARLPKAVPITEQEWPDGTIPEVSIFCMTYNHARFIQNAIDGFLMQETTFPVEVFVHDDASADGTANIVKEYAAKYPRLFWTVLQTENQRSQGNNMVPNYVVQQRGKLIAYCEGDDFWTDRNKLQIQFELLTRNPHFSCCFHRTKLVDEANLTISEDYFIPEANEFTFVDCLTKLTKAYATCSMVFRADALQDTKRWFTARPNDMFLELQLARHGRIAFVDRNMGSYRRHRGGVWSGIPQAKQTLEILYRYQLLLEDPEIHRSYGTEIRHMMNKWEKSLCAKSECAAILSSQSIFHRIASILDYRCRLFAAYVRSLRRSSSN